MFLKAGGAAQAVEQLHSSSEVLSSNPSTTENKICFKEELKGWICSKHIICLCRHITMEPLGTINKFD
jgi:hypothetical protein